MNFKARLPAVFSFLILILSAIAVGFVCGQKHCDSAGLKPALSYLLGENHDRTTR
jgi:hypothetical protein